MDSINFRLENLSLLRQVVLGSLLFVFGRGDYLRHSSVQIIESFALDGGRFHGVFKQSGDSLGQMRLQLLYVIDFFDLGETLAQRGNILEHRVEYALRIGHKLTNFIANVLLNVRLAVIRVAAEELEIALQFIDLLGQSIAFDQSVRWSQLACCNQISLEHLQVLPEAFDYGISLLDLNIVFDAHGLNLRLLRLLVLVLSTVISVNELILVEFMFIT